MPSIQTLRPNVTREEAIRHFSSGLPARLRRAAFGPLRVVADVYIPFRLFQIDISVGGRRESRLLGLDAITGSLDPYDFEQAPDSAKLLLINTRNVLEPILDQQQATHLSIDKARRVLFSRGFFRMRNLKIAASCASDVFYIPYWVGFHGAHSNARLSVMDAIRRRFEGAKVRKVLQDWLRQDSSQPLSREASEMDACSSTPALP